MTRTSTTQGSSAYSLPCVCPKKRISNIPPTIPPFQSIAVHFANLALKIGVFTSLGSAQNIPPIKPEETNPKSTPFTWAGLILPNVRYAASLKKYGWKNFIAMINPSVAKIGNQMRDPRNQSFTALSPSLNFLSSRL